MIPSVLQSCTFYRYVLIKTQLVCVVYVMSHNETRLVSSTLHTLINILIINGLKVRLLRIPNTCLTIMLTYWLSSSQKTTLQIRTH